MSSRASMSRSPMGVISESSECQGSEVSWSPRNETQSPTGNDDEYDTDLEVEEETETFDMTGRNRYINACKSHGIVPASYFLRHMQDEELNMQHHGLGAVGVKVMSFPLQINTSVVNLNLEDNWMEGEGGVYVSAMLKDNCFISELNIAWNKLGRRGALAVCDMLMSNTTLEVLDLTGNQITDAEAQYIADALNENNRVRILKLGHNQLGDASAALLGPAICENDTVEEIDLSWNYFRPKGAKYLCDGIKANTRLKIVDFSFNGFGNEGAIGVYDILKLNQVLTDLRLSYNRISTPGALLIAKGMEANEMLKILTLDHNPIGVDGTKAILRAIMSENCAITQFDISGVEVDKEFIATKKEFQEGKDVTILHGLVLGDYVIKPRPKKKSAMLFNVPIAEVNAGNLFEHLKRYCEEENVNVVDVLLSLDKRREQRLAATDVISTIVTSGLPITEEQVNIVVSLLSEMENSDGFVDISPLVGVDS
ncbi:leucine-rich repeat-containing protein 74B-like [Haliotis rufescens]|uniref:leucine-rich repeat-containing protein 74B-like n=1 Tax=Haliotis rufescens TaxID=6454 RepID=UPI00201EDF00|nr:leucine-rich repeat-containing protein 74B-like [Haliotis rufescens]